MIQSKRIASLRKPLVPKPDEAEQSRQILNCLDRTRVAEIALRIKDRSGTTKILALPARLGRFVFEALGEIANGNAVRLLQIRRELTTHEAADLLNVSRTFLIGLLERRVIPYRLVGSHRRIALTDLIAYEEKSDLQRKEALDALATEAQALKLYE